MCKNGFTLIELLVVVAIIGTLSAVGIYAYNGFIDNANDKKTKNNLRSIKVEQIEYKNLNGTYYYNASQCSVLTDFSNEINSNLFGKKLINENANSYCIEGEGSKFKIYSINKESSKSFWLDNTNSNNFDQPSSLPSEQAEADTSCNPVNSNPSDLGNGWTEVDTSTCASIGGEVDTSGAGGSSWGSVDTGY